MRPLELRAALQAELPERIRRILGADDAALVAIRLEIDAVLRRIADEHIEPNPSPVRDHAHNKTMRRF